MNVELLGHTADPLQTLYRAYKGAYSKKAAVDITVPEQLREYIQRRLDVGHTSPLQFVDFTFSIEGISRACAAQLMRHHVGVSFSQQSQRYVASMPPMVTPPSIAADSLVGLDMVATRGYAYEDYTLALENGIPAEDARYIMPIGTATNVMMKVNFAALLHICDERLCTQAQWEIRKLFAKIKNLVEGVEPILGNMLGPKCMPQRGGVCNEAYEDWMVCAIGKVRPHKITLENWVRGWPMEERNAG